MYLCLHEQIFYLSKVINFLVNFSLILSRGKIFAPFLGVFLPLSPSLSADELKTGQIQNNFQKITVLIRKGIYFLIVSGLI